MNGRTESDEWLMGQVQRGDRDCLERLVRRYASSLLTFIHRMLGDRHLAEEMFQEVFLRVWTKRSTYRLERPFRAWLFTIAANLCRADRRRATKPPLPLNDDSAARFDGSPVQTAIAVETSRLVETAIDALPPQQRMVVVLRVWSGLNYSEISDVVGIAESTARSNMVRGLASLREALGRQLN